MKAPRRIDSSVCGAVLSARVPLSLPLQSLPTTTGPVSSRIQATRCIHDQRRRQQRHGSAPGQNCRPGPGHGHGHGRPRTSVSWIPAGGKADPASGTLLPMLFPPAWNLSWKRPTAHKAMHFLENSCHGSNRPNSASNDTQKSSQNSSLRHSRGSHSSASASAEFWRDDDDRYDEPSGETVDEIYSQEPHENHYPHDTHNEPRQPPFYSYNSDTPWPREKELSREELLSFVDPPPEGETVADHLNLMNDPFMRRYATADDKPEVRVSEAPVENDFPTWDGLESADVATQNTMRKLALAVYKRLRRPEHLSADEVYAIYLELTGMRMAHVPARLRHDLLKSMNMSDERRNTKSMLRFFALVADVKDSGFALSRAEWNAATSFASRYVGTSTSAEVEAAVRLWRDMEQDAGIPGNNVTFNILFDVASKAGNFTLAEMAYQEMERRGLSFNRYHHVSMIHFFGLKMNADGVRAAYKELVESGELVDVVVFNCVIASFLRCGEEDAAERVYRHMHPRYKLGINNIDNDTNDNNNGPKTDTNVPPSQHPSSQSHSIPPPREINPLSIPSYISTTNYNSQKAMTRVLTMLSSVNRNHRNARLLAGFQYLAPMQPDLATYRILIYHYASRIGSLPDVTRFLDDMKMMRIPLHGTIFLALFKGFANHGDRNGTGAIWSEQRLRSIWAALLKALDDEVGGLYISTWLVMWALRAFDRCSQPEMVFKAYNSLMSRWEPNEVESEFVINALHALLKNRRSTTSDLGLPTPSKDDNEISKTQNSLAKPQPPKSVLGQLGKMNFG